MLRIPKPAHVRRFFATKLWPPLATFAAEELQAVLAHYDLGHWHATETLGGGDSENIVLRTGQGKKVLKRHSWPWPHPLIEHSLFRYLAGIGFPVPHLVLNAAGRTYTEVGNKCYALLDFVEGYCADNYFLLPETRRRWTAQAAEVLARFHQAMAGFVPEGEGAKFDGFMPDDQRLFRDVAWHLAVLDRWAESVARKGSPDGLGPFLSSIMDQLRQDLVEAGRHYEQPDSQLPRLTIHADYKPENVLFNRDGVAAVLDFGAACVNLRALDVARGLTSFSRAGKYGVDEHLAVIFLQAYLCRQPLSDREVSAIPDLIRWRHLRNIVWKIDYLEAHPPSQARDTHLAFMRSKWQENLWMKAHGERLQVCLLKGLDAQITRSKLFCGNR